MLGTTPIKLLCIRSELLEFDGSPVLDTNWRRKNANVTMLGRMGLVMSVWHISGWVLVRNLCSQLPGPGQKWPVLGLKVAKISVPSCQSGLQQPYLQIVSTERLAEHLLRTFGLRLVAFWPTLVFPPMALLQGAPTPQMGQSCLVFDNFAPFL